MDFEEYHLHVESARDPLDRLEEIKMVKRAEGADWAFVMQAFISGGTGPLYPAYLLEKLEGAKHRSHHILDEIRRKEYFRLKLEYMLLQEKRKANEKAAAIRAIEECQKFGGWT